MWLSTETGAKGTTCATLGASFCAGRSEQAYACGTGIGREETDARHSAVAVRFAVSRSIGRKCVAQEGNPGVSAASRGLSVWRLVNNPLVSRGDGLTWCICMTTKSMEPLKRSRARRAPSPGLRCWGCRHGRSSVASGRTSESNLAGNLLERRRNGSFEPRGQDQLYAPFPWDNRSIAVAQDISRRWLAVVFQASRPALSIEVVSGHRRALGNGQPGMGGLGGPPPRRSVRRGLSAASTHSRAGTK